jgi:cholesterol oxidase
MAREWCQANSVPLPNRGTDVPPPSAPPATTTLRFTEEMRGYAAAGATDPKAGHDQGKAAKTKLEVKLTVHLDDAGAFMTDPAHQGRLEGTVTSPLIGGTRPVQRGTFNLFVHQDDPRRKEMRYRVLCTDGDGKPVTLSGIKKVENESGLDLVEDTTVLFVRLFEGDVERASEPGAAIRGAGIIRLEFFDLLRQLTTFRVEGPTLGARIAVLNRFGGLFLGKLWDVYGQPAAGLQN